MKTSNSFRRVIAVTLMLAVMVPLFMVWACADSNDIKPGTVVTFGSYEQDNIIMNGTEPIEWYVLYAKDDQALLLSKYALFSGAYNDDPVATTWDGCSLRSWMNDVFYEAAFTSQEQKAILTAIVTAEKNPVHSTSAGDQTEDKVFLLSISEAKKFLTDKKLLKGVPTEYAVSNGTRVTPQDTCWYWLRTPGKTRAEAAYVTTEIKINQTGVPVSFYDSGVRPAIWVDLTMLM